MFNVVTDPEAENVPMLVVFSNDKKKKHLEAKELSELLMHELTHPHPTALSGQLDDVSNGEGEDFDDDDESADDDYGDDDASYDDYDATVTARGDSEDEDEEEIEEGSKLEHNVRMKRSVPESTAGIAAATAHAGDDTESKNEKTHASVVVGNRPGLPTLAANESQEQTVDRVKRSALLDYNRRHYEALDMQRKMLGVVAGGGGGGGAKVDVVIPADMPVISVARAHNATADAIRSAQKARIGKKKNKGRRGKKNMCRRRSLYVNFEDIHWNSWIIAPRGYQVTTYT